MTKSKQDVQEASRSGGPKKRRIKATGFINIPERPYGLMPHDLLFSAPPATHKNENTASESIPQNSIPPSSIDQAAALSPAASSDSVAASAVIPEKISPISIPSESIPQDSILQKSIQHSSIESVDPMGEAQHAIPLIRFDPKQGREYIRLFHDFRKLKKEMSPAEYLVLEELYALSIGFHQNYTHEPVGYNRLSALTGLSRNGVIKAITSLIKHHYLVGVSSSTKGRVWLLNIPLRGIVPLSGIPPSDEQKSLSGTPLYHSVAHNQKKKSSVKIIDKNHHHTTQTVYQTATGNQWKKSDDDAYLRIQQIPLEKIEQGIHLANQRAASRPNSLNYFVKEILNLAQPNEHSRTQRKKALEKIVERVRAIHTGEANYSFPDFVEDVKRACAREDVAFDNDLLNEILG